MIILDRKIGHGCFVVSWDGFSYSHSHEECNHFETGFKYDRGDVIRVETNGDELLFLNETRKKTECRVKMKLTEEEW